MKSTIETKMNNLLKGKKIVGCRYTSEKEKEMFMWDKSTLVIMLDDGTSLLSSSDEEMNDCGVLHLFKKGDYELIPRL
jgi:hypothetical protein